MGVTTVDDADAAAEAQADATVRRASTLLLWLVQDADPTDAVRIMALKTDMDGQGVGNEE